MPDTSVGGTITPKEQIIVKAVRNLDANTFPCPLTGAAIRQLGEHIMFDRNPGKWTVPVNCSEWCEQNPGCPCPALYPQWVSSNGSCGKVVLEGSQASVVMCGEVDEEGANCYYLYHVCKEADGSINRKWVGKQVGNACPGTSGDPECTIPLCDNQNDPPPPSTEPCDPQENSKHPNLDLSHIHTMNAEQDVPIVTEGETKDTSIQNEGK